MGQVTASASTTVAATPEEVLGFLRDYAARPEILTGNYTQFAVDPSGVLSYHFAAGGRERDYRLVSTERDGVLEEKDELSSFINVWSAVSAGGGSTVTLTGSWDGAKGFGGVMEGLFAPIGLRRIYAQILENLAATLRK